MTVELLIQRPAGTKAHPQITWSQDVGSKVPEKQKPPDYSLHFLNIAPTLTAASVFDLTQVKSIINSSSVAN